MDDIAWYSLGAVAAALTTFGFVPQVLKIWKTRSVRDISPITFVQFAAGVVLWAIYGAHIGDPVVVCANVVALSILVVGILLYFRFARRERPRRR